MPYYIAAKIANPSSSLRNSQRHPIVARNRSPRIEPPMRNDSDGADDETYTVELPARRHPSAMWQAFNMAMRANFEVGQCSKGASPPQAYRGVTEGAPRSTETDMPSSGDASSSASTAAVSRCRGALPGGVPKRFNGVTKHKRTQRFEAHIWESKKQIYLGGFESESKAAKSHDIMALRCKGRGCTVLNYSLESYSELLPLLECLPQEDIVTMLREYSREQTSRKTGRWPNSTATASAARRRHGSIAPQAGASKRPAPPRVRVPRSSSGSDTLMCSATQALAHQYTCDDDDGLPPAPQSVRAAEAHPGSNLVFARGSDPVFTPGASRAALRRWMVDHDAPASASPSPARAVAAATPALPELPPRQLAGAAARAEMAAAAVRSVLPQGLRPTQVAYLGSPGSGERSAGEPTSGGIDLPRDSVDLDSLLDVFIQNQSLECTPGDLSPISVPTGLDHDGAGAALLRTPGTPPLGAALAAMEENVELEPSWSSLFEEEKVAGPSF